MKPFVLTCTGQKGLKKAFENSTQQLERVSGKLKKATGFCSQNLLLALL
jgi:hypothetical protein